MGHETRTREIRPAEACDRRQEARDRIKGLVRKRAGGEGAGDKIRRGRRQETDSKIRR